ncbi:MAG: O-antigen ligase family protein [Erythrobacter sp.]
MPTTTNPRGLPSHLTILLIIAVLIGGGGIAYGLANLTVQLAAIALLAINREAFVSFWRSSVLPLRILVTLTILLPIVHLIPLPPIMWSALPGRELAVDARAAIGPLLWHPISLDSGRTLVSVLGLIVPLVILVIGISASSRTLIGAGWTVVALGLANFALGTAQVLYPNSNWFLFPENPMTGVLFGTFANRNSTGIFLVVCLSLLLHLPELGPATRSKLARTGAGLLLVLAIILTQSRSAMALAAIPLVSAMLRWAPQKLLNMGLGRGAIAKAVLATLGAIAAALALAPGSRLESSLERFAIGNEARQYIWEDAAYSSRKYWPVGSGMGTFDEVFQVDESLENLSTKTAGRAHNDYLELAIEGGLAGLLLITAWALTIAWACWQARALPDPWLAWIGGLIWLIIGFQSISDYPLRNQAMLATAAYALALIFRSHKGARAAPL